MLSIYGGIAVVMLGYLDSSHAVGVYVIASKIPAVLVALAIIWTSVLFPHTARQLHANPEGLASELGSVTTAAIVVLMLAGCGAAVCGNTLIPALFGQAFRAASTPFVLLSVAAGLALIEATFSNVLLASESRRYYAICLTAAAALMVILNACLIPPLGIVGSAIAAIAGEAFIIVSTVFAVVRLLGPIPVEWWRVVRGGIAVATTAVIMAIVQHYLGLLPALAAGGMTFTTAAWALRVFDRALWKSVKLPA
jgi:O-antigen/teichoic acid export membrane protein